MIGEKQYLEKTKHGTAMFPIDFYYCVYPAGLAGLPVHWHEEFEITSVQGGSCTYYIDLEPYPVAAGDFLFLPAGVLHGIPEGGTRFLETESFVFHPDLLGSRRDICHAKYAAPVETGEIRFPYVIRGGAADLLNGTFALLKRAFQQKKKGYEMEVKALLLHSMVQLFQQVPYERREQENTEVTDKLKTALQYIKEHYQQPVSVKELADACHFSEYYFMRFFKQHMHMTCVEYLNQYRMDIAAGKLSSGDGSITEIAMDAGFNNISYFNRVFKKSFGMTPREYRRGGTRQKMDLSGKERP